MHGLQWGYSYSLVTTWGNTKDYGGKIHYTDSQNNDKSAPSGRELYHLQFSHQAASPETFGYTLALMNIYYKLRSNSTKFSKFF
jgi:hypothetical protein